MTTPTPEMIKAIEAKKYRPEQGIDVEMASFNDGLDAAIEVLRDPALALVPGEQKQFLPTEDGEFNGNVSIVPPHCNGYSFVFEPGVLHVKKDGSGYIAVNEEDFVVEDDRTEGPDGPEGSIHWIARLDPSEIVALRDFLNGAPAPLPMAVKANDGLCKDLENCAALWSEYSTADKCPTFSRGDARYFSDIFAKALTALSSPVGGMEDGWRDIDDQAVSGERILLLWKPIGGLSEHIELGRFSKAATGWVNTYGKPFSTAPDKWAPLAPFSPTPASDIAALREAGERLLKACDAYDSDEWHTYDSACAYSDALEDFRSALHHVAKGERG